jgi:hypothetical protein
MRHIAVSSAHEIDTGDMALLARAIIKGRGDRGDARGFAQGMPERVQKAVQAPLATSDADVAALAFALSILTEFAPLLRNSSLFFRLWVDELLVRLPWKARISFLTGALVGGVPGQGGVTRVTRIASDQTRFDPTLVAGIVVFTKELLTWLSEAGDAFLNQELKRAITLAVDRAFLALITDGSTPSRSSIGGSGADAVDDIKFLLNSCGLTAESKPIFAMAPDVAIKAATLYDAGTGKIFAEMGPLGGLLLGIPAMVIDSLDAGELALIDGAGIAANLEGFQVSSSRNAMLQLDDAPNSPPTASTTMVSLFQSNLVALKPEIFFGAGRLRDSAYCKVTGVGWGGMNSPP